MKLMKFLGMFLLALSFTYANANAAVSAQEQVAGVQRAAETNQKMLLAKIAELKRGKVLRTSFSTYRDCHEDDHEDDKTTCVSNCTWRNVDGSCLSYGADFCGPNASCTPNCTWRNVDGSCLTYGSDICD